MSNMLIEKRNELANKLDALETARQAEIETKVALYRESLEASIPKDDQIKLVNILNALDEVIAYEAANEVSSQPNVEETKQEANTVHEARPGMSSIFIPRR